MAKDKDYIIVARVNVNLLNNGTLIPAGDYLNPDKFLIEQAKAEKESEKPTVVLFKKKINLPDLSDVNFDQDNKDSSDNTDDVDGDEDGGESVEILSPEDFSLLSKEEQNNYIEYIKSIPEEEITDELVGLLYDYKEQTTFKSIGKLIEEFIIGLSDGE